jgi:lipopolysaccharide biosynthesis glycosyltransferase
MNIIFLINIHNPAKPNRTNGYELSIKSWTNWAKKNECEVFVLTEPVVDLSQMSPIIMRHYVFDLLEGSGIEYDQICMVDADTIVHPDCPNFFELTDRKFCAVHNDGDYDWLIRSLENYQFEFNTKPITPDMVWTYFNTGFMVTNKDYKFLHDRVLGFYWDNRFKIQNMQAMYGVGTDQPLINMVVNNSDDVEIKLLPYQFNMQDLARKNALDDRMLFTEIPGVYHFNAVAGGPDEVNHWLNKTYNYLWGEV